MAAVLRVTAIDHVVLTVADVEATCSFYERVLGMEPVTFAEDRRALRLGDQRLNLHPAGAELEPHAARPTPGSADLCVLTSAQPVEVEAHLAACGVPIELGPVPREGAAGALVSIYVRDPDGNLVEVAALQSGPTGR
jgi:catechol 2,3-dioxygenase-like lactoylglutathione lyase family enzyme